MKTAETMWAMLHPAKELAVASVAKEGTEKASKAHATEPLTEGRGAVLLLLAAAAMTMLLLRHLASRRAS